MRIAKTMVVLLTLAAILPQAQAQIIWEHKTSEIWLNSETSQLDSSICFTAISCYGDHCTAVAKLLDAPINPVGRLAFYRSDDGGLTWAEQPNDLPNDDQSILNNGVTKIQQIDSLHAVAIAEPGVFIYTADGGISWHRKDCPVKRRLLDVHFSDPLTGILISSGYDSLIFTTTDGGINWVNHPFYGDNYFSGHSYGGNKFSFYKYAYGPVYVTNDNFKSIDSTKYTYDLIDDPDHRYVFARCSYGNGDTIIAHGTFWPKDTNDIWSGYGTIMRSTNGGSSWEEPWVYPTQFFNRIDYLSSLDRDTIFATGGDNSHYLISTDRGRSWQADSIIIDTNCETQQSFGIEMSRDGRPIAIFGSPIFAIRSVIVRGKYVQSKVEWIEHVVYDTHLYPNPSSGIVNIESIDKTGVPIYVTDILGREVMRTKLSGEGRVRFDLSHFPHGIYNVLLNHDGTVFSIGKIALTNH